MREQQFRTTPDYLHQGEPQAGSEQAITPHMRMIVVSWLTEVTDEFHAGNETLHLSVHLLDRFLSQTQVRAPVAFCSLACCDLSPAVRPCMVCLHFKGLSVCVRRTYPAACCS
jgi:hypothetical protein